MSCLDVMYPAYGHYAAYAPSAPAFISSFQVAPMLREMQRDMASLRAEVRAGNTKHQGGGSAHVDEAEQHISDIVDELLELEAEVVKLQVDNKKRKSKILDLESRSCRNNLRLVGVVEGEEGDNMKGMKIIPEFISGTGVAVPSISIQKEHIAWAKMTRS